MGNGNFEAYKQLISNFSKSTNLIRLFNLLFSPTQSRQTFRKIVLKRAFQKRKIYEQLLEKVEMLKSLEVYERMNLCDALVPKSFPDGSIIIKEVSRLVSPKLILLLAFRNFSHFNRSSIWQAALVLDQPATFGSWTRVSTRLIRPKARVCKQFTRIFADARIHNRFKRA